jgi:hypothetical protein
MDGKRTLNPENGAASLRPLKWARNRLALTPFGDDHLIHTQASCDRETLLCSRLLMGDPHVRHSATSPGPKPGAADPNEYFRRARWARCASHRSH